VNTGMHDMDVKSILLEARRVEARRREVMKERAAGTGGRRAVLATAIIVALAVLIGPAVLLIIQNIGS